jgi:hypothetical protein
MSSDNTASTMLLCILHIAEHVNSVHRWAHSKKTIIITYKINSYIDETFKTIILPTALYRCVIHVAYPTGMKKLWVFEYRLMQIFAKEILSNSWGTLNNKLHIFTSHWILVMKCAQSAGSSHTCGWSIPECYSMIMFWQIVPFSFSQEPANQGTIVLPHPPYSPDITPCFFLLLA